MTEKSWILLCHAGILIGYGIPFGNIVISAVIYFSKKEESNIIGKHARESLNFQISFVLFMLLFLFWVFIATGWIFLLIFPAIHIILLLIATKKADDEEFCRYPLTIRFV